MMRLRDGRLSRHAGMMRGVAALFMLAAASHVGAQTPDLEFTPGPRMIRQVEQATGLYAHLGPMIGLTAEQREAMAEIVRRLKTEMWMKEAVLVGMFQELEEKRRHGLLRDGEYRIANTLTGGIETDELNLFIESLSALRALLTDDQRAKVRGLPRSAMAFRLPQGFNTMIGQRSLDGIGRVYNVYRDELGLSQAQLDAIRPLLEGARREVLRLGTEIDLNRAEADEQASRLDVDPETVRAMMQRTGETEGVLFTKLFTVSDQIEAQLTEEQRTKLAELKRRSQRDAGEPSVSGHAGMRHADHRNSGGFDYFLGQRDRLRLTPDQIAALVDVKNETRKGLLIEQAKLKVAELALLALLDGQSDEKLEAAVRDLEDIRARMTQLNAKSYLKARALLSPGQQRRTHPPRTLDPAH
ncbi:MAG TPA: hypothetical protein VFS39_13545 [Nitrospira sp.]|nr:hypothetical protein [Nitrospira sp.]